MSVPFTKASACGNDFLIMDGANAPADLHEFSKRICDRHNGVGADGVEWLFPAQNADADIHARLINADGSEAEISGNGTRCVAAYMVSQGHSGKIAISTGAGVKHCDLVSREEHRFEFEMEMGEPQVGSEFSMTVGFAPTHGTPVSMGYPHYVVFVTEFSPVWQKEGAEIGRHPDFKHGVNVEFVRVQGDREIEVGLSDGAVGETQSSGPS